MQTNITDILSELYALDPELQKKEPEIKKIIEKMIHNKPDIKIDEAFRAELRAKVMAAAKTPKQNWFDWKIPAMSLALCGLLGVFVWQNGVFETSKPIAISFRPVVTNVTQAQMDVSVGTSSAWNARTQSGGGGPESAMLGTDVAMSSKMIAPDSMIYPPVDYPIYTYSFDGEINLPTEPQTVYKRNPVWFDWRETTDLIKNFAVDGINLGKFRNLGVANISLTEDRDFGYMINIDFVNGSIGMYQNYLRWPQIKCDQNGCEEPKKLTESDIPTDEKISAVAGAFVAEYGIDVASYGAPIVDKSWRIWYARSVAEGQSYVPDMYTVTYPLIVEGQEIYQEWGMPRGLTLTYDIRTSRITSLYGIEKLNLWSAQYEPITDIATIKEMIKNGGRYIYTTPTPIEGRKVVDIKLWEPTLKYVNLYGEWRDGKTDEFFVPAYIFPVETKPDDNYFMQNNIVVPLVQEFVQKIENQYVDPIIYQAKPAIEPALIDTASNVVAE